MSQSIKSMKFGSKTFHCAWLLISLLVGLWVVGQISPQRIHLRTKSFDLNQKIDEPCKDPSDPTSCDVSRSSNETMDVSQLSKQFESFDNFFPLSSIAKLNLKVFGPLKSNVYLEVTKPKYSKEVSNIKVSCSEENSPRFDSENPVKKFKSISPISVSALIFNYFSCERPTIRLVGPSSDEKIVVGPNEFVKFVTHGDGIVITQERYILVEANAMTKGIIFLIIFFLSLGAGSVLSIYLRALNVIDPI